MMKEVIDTILQVIVVVALTAGTAFAAHPLITDDTGTQGKGKFQVELNGEYGHETETDEFVEQKEGSGSLETVFSAGLVDTIDFVVTVPYEWSRVKENGIVASDTDGLGDVSLELKWRFFESNGFSLAFKPSVTFPSANEDKGLGTGKVGFGATIIATHEFDPFALHLNLGYSHTPFKMEIDRDASRCDIWHASLAGTAEVMAGLQIVANVGLETNPDKTSDTPPVFFIGGAIYSVTEWLDVDAGVKTGLTKPETDVSLLAGLSVRF